MLFCTVIVFCCLSGAFSVKDLVAINNLSNAARDELGKMDVSLSTLIDAFGTPLFIANANGPNPNPNPIPNSEPMKLSNLFNSNFEYFGQGFEELRVRNILLYYHYEEC